MEALSPSRVLDVDPDLWTPSTGWELYPWEYNASNSRRPFPCQRARKQISLKQGEMRRGSREEVDGYDGTKTIRRNTGH